MNTRIIKSLVLCLPLHAACSTASLESAPYAEIQANSAFQLAAGSYCRIKDDTGQERMQVPCEKLAEFLNADAAACQSKNTGSFVPWTASFPLSKRELRLCRSYARPARAQQSRVRFLVFGDAGRGNAVGPGYAQSRVGAAMQRLCADASCDFALVNGDLIYPVGVRDVFDSAFDSRFETPYRDFGAFDFYLVPGNHDYMGNVDADVEYTYFSDRWRMPKRHFGVPDLPPWLSIYGIDTTPLVGEALPNTRAAQTAAVQRELCAGSGWRILFGHHPPVSHGDHGDSAAMGRILDEWSASCPFHLYLGGHDHHQEHLSTELFDVLIEGAGGASLRAVQERAPPRLWGPKERTVEQRFAKSAHGFALVDVTPEAMTISLYALDAWKFAAAEPLSPIAATDYIYRCSWRFGEPGGCKPETR